MLSKTEQITFCLEKIHDILEEIRPGNRWFITYGKSNNLHIDEWDKKYLGIIDDEEYFFVYIEDYLTYAVNVTGDSVLTAIQELITKLAAKF